MAILKQSTTYTRMFMMIDSSDHVTGKTGLTVTVTLSKAGGAFAAAGATITEVSSGWYKAALTTTDTNTLGDLAYHCTATGADPTDFADQVSARLMDDLAYPATSGRSMVVDSSGVVDANIVNAGGTAWASGSLTSGVFASGAITATAIAADAIGASELAADAIAEIADGIWDEVQSGHTTTGTFGKYLDAQVSAIGSPPSAATIAAAVWDLDATGHQTQGTFGQVLGDSASDSDSVWSLANTNLDAAVSSRLASGSYTAPDNTSITAIKTKTDQLAFTVSNQVDANIQSVNDVTVTGTGSSGDEWGP